MPRFVLLRHECPSEFKKPSHWDFMLEWHGVLRTWELRELPKAWGNALGEKTLTRSTAAKNIDRTTVEAFPLPDHRIAYLNYEGPISQGRGEVVCCDRGTYLIQAGGSNQLTLRLFGKFLQEPVSLTQLATHWELCQFAE